MQRWVIAPDPNTPAAEGHFGGNQETLNMGRVLDDIKESFLRCDNSIMVIKKRKSPYQLQKPTKVFTGEMI